MKEMSFGATSLGLFFNFTSIYISPVQLLNKQGGRSDNCQKWKDTIFQMIENMEQYYFTIVVVAMYTILISITNLMSFLLKIPTTIFAL